MFKSRWHAGFAIAMAAGLVAFVVLVAHDWNGDLVALIMALTIAITMLATLRPSALGSSRDRRR